MFYLLVHLLANEMAWRSSRRCRESQYQGESINTLYQSKTTSILPAASCTNYPSSGLDIMLDPFVPLVSPT